MINEGIFRSPKWLRNFIDFEINTGNDIKGEPSKRSVDREKKRKEKEALKLWDQTWDKAVAEVSFNKFLNVKLGKASYNTFYSYEFRDLKARFRGDNSLFVQYNAYLEEKEAEKKRKEAEEKRQKELTEEITRIIDSILEDFNRAPYNDKISGYRNRNNEYCIKYRFENGDIIDINNIDSRTFKFETKKQSVIYTLGILLFNRLVTIINNISKRQRTRPGGYKNNDYYSGEGTKSKSSDPKRDRYETLLKTIKLREEQLKKLSKDDEQRVALENELNAVKRMAKKLKDEYKFENIKGFKDFDENINS